MLDLGFTREREGSTSTSDCRNFGFFSKVAILGARIVQTRL
jgi:hypothetical protein